MIYRLFVIVLLAYSLQSHANISRGAYENGNSSTIVVSKSKSSDKLVVNKEKLDFRCVGTTCEVSAVYYITSVSNFSSKLFFIAPMKGSKPQVWVNNVIAKVDETTYKIANNAPPDNKDFHRAHHGYENRYGFTARFKRSHNVIKVTYSQSMSMYTASSFGIYPFLSREYNHYFAYYLYPLKSWKLDPNFDLAVHISFIPNKPRIKIKCRAMMKKNGLCLNTKTPQPYCVSKLKPKTYKIIKKTKLLEYRFGNKFPDTLECHVGRKVR